MSLHSATNAVDFSRVLFGFATEFHYLFVPLTIGLMALIAFMDGLAWHTGKATWERAGLFWGRFFVLNFVCGVLTGWPLRHHLQAQWTGYSQAAAEVLKHVFALEGRLAPYLFGLVIAFALRRRLPTPLRFAISLSLACALIAQSLSILALNAWMQKPVGIALVGGMWKLVDPGALFANPLLASKVMHTLAAAYVLGGAFVMAGSAWFLLRGRETSVASASLRLAGVFTLISLFLTGLAGHRSGELIAHHQPAKFAAIEAIWQPRPVPAPLTLLAWPDASSRSNRYALEVPGLLGWLAGGNKQPLQSMQDIEQRTALALREALSQPAREGSRLPDNMSVAQYQASRGVLSLLGASQPRGQDAPLSEADITQAARRALPPVAPVFWGFRFMVGLWVSLTTLLAVLVWKRGANPDQPGGRHLLRACLLALPLAWLANAAGWMVCEMGRQPWTITGVLSTAQSHSGVGAFVSLLSLAGWGMVYAALLYINIQLSRRWLRQGSVATLSREAQTTRPVLSGSDKRRIVAATLHPGASLESIAHKHRISVRQLRHWIQLLEMAGRMPS